MKKKQILAIPPWISLIFWENKDSSVTVSSIDAEKQLGVTSDERLSMLGREVNELLIQAIDSI